MFDVTKMSGDKRQRVFSFDHQKFIIVLFAVFSFINSLIFLWKMVIHFFYLYSFSKSVDVKDCVTSYNQCLLSATNELSSNLKNKFRCNIVQNINFKFKSVFLLYLFICESVTEQMWFLILLSRFEHIELFRNIRHTDI